MNRWRDSLGHLQVLRPASQQRMEHRWHNPSLPKQELLRLLLHPRCASVAVHRTNELAFIYRRSVNAHPADAIMGETRRLPRSRRPSRIVPRRQDLPDVQRQPMRQPFVPARSAHVQG